MRSFPPRLVLLLVAVMALGSPPTSAATGYELSTLEELLLVEINDARASRAANPVGSSGAFVMHQGLREAAREHGKHMAQTGSLNHDRLHERVMGAEADPPQPEGGADQGFTGAYCENTTWFRGSDPQPTERIVQAMYRQFASSGSHRACMFDHYGSGLNVAAVGFYEEVHEEGRYTIWATLTLARDETVPGVPLPDPIAPDPVDPLPAQDPVAAVPSPADPLGHAWEDEVSEGPGCRALRACLNSRVGISWMERGLA